MSGNISVFDISSDDESFAQSSCLKILPFNKIRVLNLSGEPTKELQGYIKSTGTSASTFYSEGSTGKCGVDLVPNKESEAFLIEEQAAPEAETS